MFLKLKNNFSIILGNQIGIKSGFLGEMTDWILKWMAKKSLKWMVIDILIYIMINIFRFASLANERFSKNNEVKIDGLEARSYGKKSNL